MLKRTICLCATAFTVLSAMVTTAQTQSATASNDSVKSDAVTPNYIDEVLWVVGDEAILRSDIEVMRLQGEQEGVDWGGDPDCRIPEQLAVQKLFINQAAIDSIEVTEAEIAQGVEQQINAWIQMIGSKEKLEEYRKQSISQMRSEMHDEFKNRELAQRMRRQLVEDVTVTPADVRNYFYNIPEDSIPFVQTTVEVQLITIQPRIPIEEINKVKDELRDYTNRVQSGATSFATLARLYSEDPGSARQGGEMDYVGRGMLDPAFAQVAFNLTDPKKISKIVESEFDSIGDDLRANKFPFDEAATVISDDKDTRSNHGLMSITTDDGKRTSRIEMKDLPTEVARAISNLQPGEISKSFTMVNSRGKTVCAIAKLRNRTEGHRATITEDFQVMSDVVLAKAREKKLHDWVQEKIKNTYVRIAPRFRDCNDFEYEGWVK